jgi:adenosylcobinamide-phosphate synthase
MPDAFSLPLAALAAVLLDRLFGEPQRWHPLLGFGRLAVLAEARLNRRTAAAGILALGLMVGPWVALAFWLQPLMPGVVDIALLYFALGARSLSEHAEAVQIPLAKGDLPEARRRVGWMVSRDTATLDATGVAKAGVESVLENGNDAVFGALFWFALLGGPGALLFRLTNTLDAMWGYKTDRFLAFGWAAARFDDLLNWPAARLTALTYALLGRPARALACWRAQAGAWESPNAGPVMAAGAGTLGIVLGGSANYHGREELRPPLGEGGPACAGDIGRAVTLVQRGLWLWLAVLLIIGTLHA